MNLIIILCFVFFLLPHASLADCCIVPGNSPQAINADASCVGGSHISGDCPAQAAPSTPNTGSNTSDGSEGGQSLPNPLGVTSIPQLIGIIIKGFLGIIGSIALLMFLYGGFVWMTSAGNEKKVEKGKEVLTWAIIGLLVIFSSYVLVNFVIQGLTAGG